MGTHEAHPEVETFVEMWRYTLPWCITLNDAGKYSYSASKNKIYGDYYRFIMGIRGVAHDFDDRWKQSKTDSLEHDNVVLKIEQLWTKGSEFFFHGRFMDDIGITLSDDKVFAKSYASKNAIAVSLWNNTDKALAFNVTVDAKRILLVANKIKEVTSLETNRRIPFKTSGNNINIQLQIPANSISIVVLR